MYLVRDSQQKVNTYFHNYLNFKGLAQFPINEFLVIYVLPKV